MSPPPFQVSEGSGRALVIAVGLNSEWGKTMTLMEDAGDDPTPLQARQAPDLSFGALSIDATLNPATGKTGP